ncbi:DnaJ-class molecular chaperone with C-terminal Zn finger domain [Bernardetia litoralis DSM 6794]|uniref:DnaJ-class molecular chaperone with C-terminal Zn finger domain n=1 Tax=Bernardetia litoralis (strain ATCC 23117 / DSM 6794 / NBRC 15988 / NCIMB 1366 / Fx l1 / Sio-4) TaxID=880071 RepID=I4APY7_BERLS|nr:J domain-containing protein [Bernardetia litoralis]AFM06022.1 DnaJ-class molecular chaperone with C-terminal Zn finger domain [Bernardetia litoralis DSM 6794]
MQNHYTTLGIPELASQEEAKVAFKRLAVEYHPDKNPNNPVAEELFKQINEAYQVLSNPVTKESYDVTLRFAYSYSYYANQRPTEADQNFQRYYSNYTERKKDPKNTNLYSTLISIAFVAYMFLVVHSVQDFLSRVYYYQALQSIEVEDYKEAIEELSYAIAYDNSFSTAYYLRAKLYSEHFGFPNGALKDYTKAIDNALIQESDFYLERGIAYSQVNEKQGAITDFATALDLSKYEQKTAQEIAKEYYNRLKEYELAIEIYTTLIQQDSTKSIYYEQRALAYSNLQQDNLAQQDFERIIQKSNNPIEKRAQIVEKLENEVKNYKLALENNFILLNENPTEPNFHYTRSNLFFKLNDNEKGRYNLDLAILYNEGNKKLYVKRAKLFLDNDQPQKACKDWIKAKELGNTIKHTTLDFFCFEEK